MTAKSIFDRRKAFGAVICGVLCLLMLVGLAFMTKTDAHAATVTAIGTCGRYTDQLRWGLDSDGVLTIYGSGEMDNYINSAPWDKYKSNIKSIVIMNGAESIGNYAFSGCSNIKSITIPDSVTSIGERAFYNCSNLTSITIPDSVTSIGANAFENTGYYNDEANWENGVLYIGKHLTDVKTSISGSYTIKDGTLCIADRAFWGCNDLEGINVAEGNSRYHSAGNCLIETKSKTLKFGCKNSVIPSDGSVTSIGAYAFGYIKNLTNITIPDSVTSIERYAFETCYSLASVNMGNGVTVIGDNAFEWCKSLTSITIPESITNCFIGSRAFSGCSKLKLVIINSAYIASRVAYSYSEGYLLYDATTVAIRADITTIGSYITSNFTNINTFDIEGVSYNVYSKHTHSVGDANWTVAENGDQVCSECGLTVAAPAPAKTEGYCGNNVKWAFDDETSTLTITGKGAMKGYSSETMPWYAYASQIKKVVIGEGVTSIGKNAFNNEKAGFVFPEISLPSTLTSIGRYAFYNCASLTEIALPASVDTIGRFAFRGTGITNYTLGRCGKTADWMLDNAGTLTIFGDGAMYDFGSNTAPWASYKDQIKKVVICEGVTSIGNCAFYECANITSVSLPSTVTAIGNYSFYSCRALGSVGVPADVANIGAYAFRKCTSLVTATFENADGWSYGDTSADISATALKSNYKNAWTRA